MLFGGGIRLFLAIGDEDLSVFLIPGRNAMAPPELARNAPGLDVAHPFEIGLFPVFRNEGCFAALDRRDGGLRQRRRIDIPLIGEIGLDHRHLRLFVMRNHDGLGFDAVEKFQRLDIGDDLLARVEAIEATIGFGRFVVDPAVRRQNVDLRQAVALADFEVVEVMRGRDLHPRRSPASGRRARRRRRESCGPTSGRMTYAPLRCL